MGDEAGKQAGVRRRGYRETSKLLLEKVAKGLSRAVDIPAVYYI